MNYRIIKLPQEDFHLVELLEENEKYVGSSPYIRGLNTALYWLGRELSARGVENTIHSETLGLEEPSA